MSEKELTKTETQAGILNTKGLETYLSKSAIEILEDHKTYAPIQVHSDYLGHPSPMIMALDKETVVKIIKVAVLKYSRLLWNFERNISEGQSELFAEWLLTEYPDIRIIELKRIMEHIAKGQVFSSIDPATLMRGTIDYYEESREAIAIEREKRHKLKMNEYIKDLEFVPIPKFIIDQMRESERKHAVENSGLRIKREKFKIKPKEGISIEDQIRIIDYSYLPANTKLNDK